MTPRPAAVLLALLLSGCGGGANVQAAPSPAPTVDPAVAVAAITTNWEGFFSPVGTVAFHVALLEDGAMFTAELARSSKDPAAADLSAKVTNVKFTSPQAANVTYNLFGRGGADLLIGAQGVAVLQGSRWKISKLTYCQLIGLRDPTAQHPACV